MKKYPGGSPPGLVGWYVSVDNGGLSGVADRIVHYRDLRGRESHRPSELSGGECQRGAVARALINNPKIILADEPSGSLDSENRARLHRLFFELRDEMGAGFAIVTHDESLADDADIVVHMADGRIKSIL